MMNAIFAYVFVLVAQDSSQILLPYGSISTVEAFNAFDVVVSSRWSEYFTQFLSLINSATVWYLPVLVGVPVLFLLHYLVIGPISFEHSPDERRVFFYGALVRFLHWLCALFFSLVVFSGIMILFAKAIGGGSPVLAARTVHLACAYGFVICVIPLFFLWLKDMFPAPYDLKWIFIMGGYLSKNKVPVPAGKFNLGQKTWFWFATAGGALMFYSGYHLQHLVVDQEKLVFFLKIHLILGFFILALFITHLYMALFAVRGSLQSMISGYKGESEVKLLHSRMKLG